MNVSRELSLTELTCRAYLAERITGAIYAQQLSLRMAAAKCQISKAHLCNLVNGVRSPSLDTLFRIMRGLNMPTLLSDLELML
jgi:transcriptional regulator with XRE-family HTH domain